MRINWSDSNFDKITGINLTFWKPKNNPGGTVHGISVGLFSPSADVLKGINIGGFGVSADSELSGLNFGYLPPTPGAVLTNEIGKQLKKVRYLVLNKHQMCNITSGPIIGGRSEIKKRDSQSLVQYIF